MEVQDARVQTVQSSVPLEPQENSSLLLQAVQTQDWELLDWCLENVEPPREMPSSYTQTLIQFLLGRYWVHASPQALEWIRSLLTHNAHSLKGSEVLLQVRSALSAKTSTLPQVTNLSNKLKLVALTPTEFSNKVDHNPNLVVNGDS